VLSASWRWLETLENEQFGVSPELGECLQLS